MTSPINNGGGTNGVPPETTEMPPAFQRLGSWLAPDAPQRGAHCVQGLAQLLVHVLKISATPASEAELYQQAPTPPPVDTDLLQNDISYLQGPLTVALSSIRRGQPVDVEAIEAFLRARGILLSNGDVLRVPTLHDLASLNVGQAKKEFLIDILRLQKQANSPATGEVLDQLCPARTASRPRLTISVSPQRLQALLRAAIILDAHNRILESDVTIPALTDVVQRYTHGQVHLTQEQAKKLRTCLRNSTHLEVENIVEAFHA